jgi:hypothetical protein
MGDWYSCPKHNTRWHSLDLSLVDQVWQNLLRNGFLLFMSKHNTIWHFLDLALLDQVWKNLRGMCFATIVSKTTTQFGTPLDQEGEQNLIGNSFDR